MILLAIMWKNTAMHRNYGRLASILIFIPPGTVHRHVHFLEGAGVITVESGRGRDIHLQAEQPDQSQNSHMFLS